MRTETNALSPDQNGKRRQVKFNMEQVHEPTTNSSHALSSSSRARSSSITPSSRLFQLVKEEGAALLKKKSTHELALQLALAEFVLCINGIVIVALVSSSRDFLEDECPIIPLSLPSSSSSLSSLSRLFRVLPDAVLTHFFPDRAGCTYRKWLNLESHFEEKVETFIGLSK